MQFCLEHKIVALVSIIFKKLTLLCEGSEAIH